MKKISLLLALLSALLFNFAQATPAPAISTPTVSTPTVSTTAASQGDNTVTFYVTRHGKTMFNSVERAQGWSDTPLTAEGIKVAEQLGKGIRDVNFKAVYSSDLGRARQTARIVLAAKGQSLNIHESENLRESCFGIFEGDLDPNMWGPVGRKLGYQSDVDLMADYAKGKVSTKQLLDTLAEVDSSGQAENFDTVKNRMQMELKQIAQDVAQQGGGDVLLVSHGVAIMVMLSDMAEPERLNVKPGNASVTKVTYKDGQFSVGDIGDMSYVKKGATINQ